MHEDADNTELTDEQKADVEWRAMNDDRSPMSQAERDYLVRRIQETKQQTKDLLLQKLMSINQYSRNKRVEEQQQFDEGLISGEIFHLLDALDAAIEETGVFITNIGEGADSQPSRGLVREYANTRSVNTFDLYEYHAYNIVAGFFRED